MAIRTGVPWLLLLSWAALAQPEPAKAWQLVSRVDGVVVTSRPKPGSDFVELRGVGEIDASPPEVWRVVRDYAHYPTIMPYFHESRVVSSEQDGKVLFVYNLLSPPISEWRDYTARIVDESKWKDGQGYFAVTWTVANDKGPLPTPKIIRVQVNDGYWRLDPRPGGMKTLATYYLHTEPGGNVPKWIVNQANITGVPDVFRAVRRAVRPGH